MTREEILSDLVNRSKKYLGDFDDKRVEAGVTVYNLIDVRRSLLIILEDTKDGDERLNFCIAKTLYAVDLSISKIMEDEAKYINMKTHGQIEKEIKIDDDIRNFDFNWKKEE